MHPKDKKEVEAVLAKVFDHIQAKHEESNTDLYKTQYIQKLFEQLSICQANFYAQISKASPINPAAEIRKAKQIQELLTNVDKIGPQLHFKITTHAEPFLISDRQALEEIHHAMEFSINDYNSTLFKVEQNEVPNPIATAIAETPLRGEYILRTNIQYSNGDFAKLRYKGKLITGRPERDVE